MFSDRLAHQERMGAGYLPGKHDRGHRTSSEHPLRGIQRPGYMAEAAHSSRPRWRAAGLVVERENSHPGDKQ